MNLTAQQQIKQLIQNLQWTTSYTRGELASLLKAEALNLEDENYDQSTPFKRYSTGQDANTF